jgi:hypothetical protein
MKTTELTVLLLEVINEHHSELDVLTVVAATAGLAAYYISQLPDCPERDDLVASVQRATTDMMHGRKN